MSKKNGLLDTLYGTLHVPDWPNDLIVRSLHQLGEWCAAEAALAAGLLESSEVLWDAGAFLGTFSLGVTKQTVPARILTIEANPAVTPALEQNLALLPCPSQIVTAGLGAKPGWLLPIGADSYNHGATAYTYSEKNPGMEAAIRCRSLRDLRQEFGNYNFIKIDLEGMELEVLRGDLPYLRDCHPLIWAECNESSDSLHLLGMLKWLKYEILYVAFPAFRIDNFRDAADLIYPMAYEAALIAGPAERLKHFARQTSELVPGEDIICHSIGTAYDLRCALFDTPRWSRAEWVNLSRAELIARLGRTTLNTGMVKFLNTPVPKS